MLLRADGTMGFLGPYQQLTQSSIAPKLCRHWQIVKDWIVAMLTVFCFRNQKIRFQHVSTIFKQFLLLPWYFHLQLDDPIPHLSAPRLNPGPLDSAKWPKPRRLRRRRERRIRRMAISSPNRALPDSEPETGANPLLLGKNVVKQDMANIR